jgi:NADH-quinone oxidoreductase subunit H
MFVIFFISALAETNRPPFDLPEAESELVAGYQVEYLHARICSSCSANISPSSDVRDDDHPVPGRLACRRLTWRPFTWVPPGVLVCDQVVFLFFMFAMVKALVPRYRYDQLMRLGWKIFLPTSLSPGSWAPWLFTPRRRTCWELKTR